MMINPSINDLDKMVESRYSLVCAVAKRARELAEGADRLVECPSDKEVTIAVNELHRKKVWISEAAEAEEENA